MSPACHPLLLLLLLLWGAEPPPPATALPIVDPGLFVIMGVKTCRAGSGYCLLGTDCTLDEDFLPDDSGGHCDGLRSAFTPSAHFVCCRDSAEPVSTTTAAPAPTTVDATEATDAPTTAQPERTDFPDQEEQTTSEAEDTDSSEETATRASVAAKKARIDVQREDAEEGAATTPSGDSTTEDVPPSVAYEEKPEGQEEEEDGQAEGSDSGKSDSQAFENDGIMMHDVLKLISEGQWQVSFRNNEVDGEATESTDSPATTAEEPGTTTALPEEATEAAGEQGATTAAPEEDGEDKGPAAPEDDEDKGPATPAGSAQQNATSPTGTSLCLSGGDGFGNCWLVRFEDVRYDSFICRGSLLHGDLVLISALCAFSLYQAGAENVRAISAGNERSMALRDIAVHEDYRPPRLNVALHDLGLVRLKSDLRGPSSCPICVADPELDLKKSRCYTFASSSLADDEVSQQRCNEVGSHETEGGLFAVKCSLKEDLRVQSGTPLVCAGTLAGVATDTAEAGSATFTPAAQLLPWLQWNVERLGGP